jgi:hypothetical protein
LVLARPTLFRELLRIVYKFQMNFGLRALVNCEKEGLVGEYIHSLFKYSEFCYCA